MGMIVGGGRVHGRLRRERIGNKGAQLLYLESEDQEKEISLYINSPGGVVTSGLAIFDTMNYIKAPVSTICLGQAASMGAFLLSAGAPGRRFALPHARIMIHQPLGGAQGQASDIQIQAEEIIRLKEKLNQILANKTGQPVEKIAQDTDRDRYLTADEAQDYGLIDAVMNPSED